MIDQTAQRTMQQPGQGIVPAGRPTVDHKEYPKHMAHPQYQPGKPGPEIKSPHGFSYNAPGTPIRFPPVLVKTAAQEEYHKSLGYETVGKSDPDAFNRAVGNGQIPDHVAYVPMEYPKWVMGKLVNNAEEEAKLVAAQDPLPPEVQSEELVLDREPDLNTAAIQSYQDKTLDQLRIEDLEAKVDRLLDLLAKATMLEPDKDGMMPRKPAKTRKAPVLTDTQKTARSEAIKAGMARKKALAESESVAQDASAPVA